MPIKLSEDEKNVVVDILSNLLPVASKVYVFGSRARGLCKKSSDLDLAIDVGRRLRSIETVDLKDAFDASSLIFRVDIVDLHAIDDAFKGFITPDFVLLFFK